MSSDSGVWDIVFIFLDQSVSHNYIIPNEVYCFSAPMHSNISLYVFLKRSRYPWASVQKKYMANMDMGSYQLNLIHFPSNMCSIISHSLFPSFHSFPLGCAAPRFRFCRAGIYVRAFIQSYFSHNVFPEFKSSALRPSNSTVRVLVS